MKYKTEKNDSQTKSTRTELGEVTQVDVQIDEATKAELRECIGQCKAVFLANIPDISAETERGPDGRPNFEALGIDGKSLAKQFAQVFLPALLSIVAKKVPGIDPVDLSNYILDLIDTL